MRYFIFDKNYFSKNVGKSIKHEQNMKWDFVIFDKNTQTDRQGVFQYLPSQAFGAAGDKFLLWE